MGIVSPLGQGFHLTVSPEAYHADPAEAPSLSASLAKLLLDQSPRHAWTASPALNPEGHERLADMDSASRARLEHGTALHALVLGAGCPVRWIDAPDYRGKEAKAEREQAHQDGEVPVLECHRGRLERIVDAALEQARVHRDLGPALDGGGMAEAAMLWREETPEGPAWCRALVDYLPADPDQPVVDWKFTQASTAPQSYERQVQGMAMRAHHYLRGLERCGRPTRDYLIAAVETTEPHGLTVFKPSTALLHFGREMWEEAARTWALHLRAGAGREHWPMYSPWTVEVGPDPWQIGRAETEALLRKEAAERSNGMAAVARSHALMRELGGPIA